MDRAGCRVALHDPLPAPPARSEAGTGMALMDRSIHRFHHYQRRGQHPSRPASPWGAGRLFGRPLGLGLGGTLGRGHSEQRHAIAGARPCRGEVGGGAGWGLPLSRGPARKPRTAIPYHAAAAHSPSPQPTPTGRDFSGICMPRSNGDLAGGAHYGFGFTPKPNTLRATFNPTAIASLECSG
jgi:hypothetical protein